MSDGKPFCSVKIEGQETIDLAVRVHVEESDSRADSAHVTFADSHLVLCDVLHEGLSIEIDMGRADEHAVVLRGLITSVVSHFPQVGGPRVEVTAQDSLILLSLEHKTRRWSNATVSSIVSEIAQANRLQPGTIVPGEDALFPEQRPAHQVAETDLAFLERLAADHDSKVWVDHSEAGDSLNFESNQRLLDAHAIEQSLEFNSTLFDFRAAFDSWAADPRERLVTTDPDSGDRVLIDTRLLQADDALWEPDATRIARLGDGGARVGALRAAAAAKRARLTDSWRRPQPVAGRPARTESDKRNAHGDRLRRRGQTGHGRAGGSIWLRPRKRVEIRGYGGRWSGVWNLARVRHDVDLLSHDYVTSFVCVR
jgi:hypothetical protein